MLLINRTDFSENIKLKKVFFYIFFIFLFIMSLFLPAIILVSIMLFIGVVYKINNISYFSISYFFAFIATLLDPSILNVYDMARIYSYIIGYGQEYVNSSKPFRNLFGVIYNIYDVEPQIYSFVCVFLGFFITFKATDRYWASFYNNESDFFSLFFLVLLNLPLIFLTSYENILSFSLLYLSSFYVFERNYIRGVLISIMAMMIHLAVLPIMLFVWFIAVFVNSVRVAFIFGLFFTVFLYVFTYINLSNVMTWLPDIILYAQSRYINYIGGPFGDYYGISDFFLIISCSIKILLAVYLIIKLKQECSFFVKSRLLHKLLMLSSFMIPVLLFFLLFQITAQRYIYFGMFYMLPILMVYLYSSKICKSHKYIVIYMVVLVILSPRNMYRLLDYNNGFRYDYITKGLLDSFLLSYPEAQEADASGLNRI
ncbi:hypothetical protein [Aeromonas enteropelogenes]|uniref:hypothetical protein n=1 Tax=Aeromonas enteropelogenes TaxID=29489 RepID=UPI000AF4F91A|nr:hypothetical protein [Aeromonas enteropelogenes]UBH50905.1 hypothetical protein LA321_12680 [Aeromonas enteropelogenes]